MNELVDLFQIYPEEVSYRKETGEIYLSVVFCHSRGTSGKDKKERKRFNKNYTRWIRNMNDDSNEKIIEKCMQCDCYIQKGCPHNRCEKKGEDKCSSHYACTKVAAHVHVRGKQRAFLIRTCKSCNSQGSCHVVERKNSFYAMPIPGRIVQDYLPMNDWGYVRRHKSQNLSKEK